MPFSAQNGSSREKSTGIQAVNRLPQLWSMVQHRQQQYRVLCLHTNRVLCLLLEALKNTPHMKEPTLSILGQHTHPCQSSPRPPIKDKSWSFSRNVAHTLLQHKAQQLHCDSSSSQNYHVSKSRNSSPNETVSDSISNDMCVPLAVHTSSFSSAA